MVDLVKIRKKAKEKKEAEQAASSSAEPQRTELRKGQTPPEPQQNASESEPAPEPDPARAAAPKPSRAQKQKPAVAPEPAAAAEPVEASRAPEQVETPASASTSAASLPDTRAAAPQSSARLDRFKEEAGRLRAQADVKGDSDERIEQVATDERLEVLTFAIGAETYAVDIEHIVEIVPVRAPTRVPNADASVVGILSLRGTIVTLVDVHRRLEHGRSPSTADSRIIVVDQNGETIGFEVDRVFRVVKIDAAEIEPHPVVHTSELDESIRGVFRQGQSLTILLDFDKLLDRREMPRAGALESLTSQA